MIIFMMTTMMMMTIAAEMWTSERPGTPGHHAAKDQEGKLAHAGYKRNYHDYENDQFDDFHDDYDDNLGWSMIVISWG